MRRAATSRKKFVLLSTLSVAALVVIIAVLELTNTTHFFHKAPAAPLTASEYTKGEPAQSSNAKAGSNSNSSTSQSSTKDSSGNTVALVQPTGNFVSSHTANSSSHEASACNTSPGATCQITFTKNGVTKSLPAKTADTGGAAYWNWTPNDVGLTDGTWHITASASLGDQNSSSNDALDLTVSQ